MGVIDHVVPTLALVGVTDTLAVAIDGFVAVWPRS